MNYFVEFHQNVRTKVTKSMYNDCIGSFADIMADKYGITELEARSRMGGYVEVVGILDEKKQMKRPAMVFYQWEFLKTYLF